MKTGIFGGTFDPPHTGHLLVASDAFEVLQLDRLVWIPTGRQPLKGSKVRASAVQRAEMLEAMLLGDQRFRVDRLEIERAGLSYTVETLTEYTRRYPGDRLFFLIGADLVAELPRWRDAERIAELAELVVLDRGKVEGAPALEAPATVAHIKFTRVATRRIDISSTEIRSRVNAGKPIAGFVTDAVARYIDVTALYR